MYNLQAYIRIKKNMRIDLWLEIKKNNVYSSAWNIFSKLILMNKLIFAEDNLVIICENEKRLEAYLSISKEFWINLSKIQDFIDVVDLFLNKKWKYIVTKDIFEIDIKQNFFEKNIFKIKKWDKISPQDLAKKLNELKIEFSEYQNPNTFFISWDLLNYTDKSWQLIKISFWWDEVDDILYWNGNIDFFVFWCNFNINTLPITEKKSYLLDIFQKEQVFTIVDSIDFYDIYDELLSILNNYLIFTINSAEKKSVNLWIRDLIINNIESFKDILNDSKNKIVITKNPKLINNFVELNNIDWTKILETSSNKLKSFSFEKGIVICDDNISRIFVKKRVKRTLSESMDLLLQIKKWDYVVHIDHWVWIFSEVLEKEIAWVKKEYLLIEYKDNDKLYVPISEIWRITKYVWVEDPSLTSLSTKDWERKLKKASEDAWIIASELLEIYAKRKLQKWFKFLPFKEEENKFFSSFEHIYTDDQYAVINDIYKDMESDTPMDRLLSWDVWFWKTEVAFAAIFKSIINWKQSALISPLVVLAYEHFDKAKERFRDFPFNIEVLTRFESSKDVKNTLKKLKDWKIDLIIWTHRLLSEDVEFKDLWLLVIDEEHKFWVKDKEKIKILKWNVDILSMSATPIPRSLNMALNWLKEVSMLTTPPVWKLSIETIVSPFDEEIIFNAWKRELDRGWQIFFIHNKVENILWMQAFLENLFPWKKVLVAHWQLSWDTLEKRIISFKKREYDILLATTVIENGIDFSNVNTIFINESNNFWISQIHQLRWRVWRWQEKAYAYLLFKKDKIKEDAAKRLKTIVDYSHLWAWFELAIKDLEIRWGWDVLWIKQSWSSFDIWISLFLEMLENKIEELKIKNDFDTQNSVKKINTTIDLNVEAYIPSDFFTSELDKLNFYREIESIKDLEDLKWILDWFEELNKKIEKSTNNLFSLIKLKILAYNHKIKTIRKVWINYQIDFEDNISIEELKKFLDLDKEVKFFVVDSHRLRSNTKNFTSDEKFVEYLLLIFEDRLTTKKIRIKKKV